jgi:hypothetical protein
MFSPVRVIELIRLLDNNSKEKIRVVWVNVSGSRAEFAAEMNANIESDAIVPIIVREAIFLSPNAVLSDVNRLFDQNRAVILASLNGKHLGCISIVVLAKADFTLPQISSPITLPDWFPVSPRTEVFLRIFDLDSESEIDLVNAPEARVDEVSSQLVQFEQALVRRFSRLLSEGRTLDQFLNVINSVSSTGKDNFASATDACREFERHVASIADARAYRPSLRTGSSLCGRLIRLVLKSSPDQLAALAKSVADGLHIGEFDLVKPPLFAVLLRPTAVMTIATRNVHSALLASYAAYQFLTAAAHAGEYPQYSLALVRATSRDLREALARLALALEHA